MPSANEQIADHLANRRVRALIAEVAGQPGAQCVRRVGLDADRQGDGGVQVQRGPDARQRGHQPEPGLLRDADPPGPHLGRGRGGQDQQRPGPHGPARPGSCGGPVRGGWSGGPRRDRTTQARVRGAGRVDGDSSHAGHHPSVVASGWGSPVSAASAAATSARLARTYVAVAPASLPLSVCPA